GLDLTEEVGSNWLELLFVGVRIQEPQGCRQAAEQGVPVLRSKTGSDNLFIASHRQALSHDDRLVQDPSKKPMVATEGEDRSGRLLVCKGDPTVRLESTHQLVFIYPAAQLQIEMNRVHVLRIQF